MAPSKNFVSSKDESVRMFKSDFLELFSKVHPITPLVVFLPVVGYFAYRAIMSYQLPWLSIAGFLLFGLAVWTLTEYVLHRFIFHYHPTSDWGKRIHFIFHGVHHDYPNDSRRLVMPPSVSIPLASLFYFLFVALLGQQATAPFFVGFIAGYMFYDLGHYAIHHFPMRSKFWMAIKNHHMKHHYQQPNEGFGVSSPIWDWILRTEFKSKTPKDHQKA
ncbi:MAG: sterol desaturase family protein [Bacteroidota bacterium]